MKVMLSSILWFQIIFSSTLFSKDIDGVSISDQETIGTTSVPLHGTGLRKAMIFVKVYLAAFYYPVKLASEEELLSKPQKFVLKLHFLRDVSKEKIIDSFMGGFKKNDVNLKDFEDAWKELQAAVDNLNKDEELIFIYDGEKLTVKCKKLEANIKKIEFVPQLLKLWFGNPPNKELKKGLLNL